MPHSSPTSLIGLGAYAPAFPLGQLGQEEKPVEVKALGYVLIAGAFLAIGTIVWLAAKNWGLRTTYIEIAPHLAYVPNKRRRRRKR